jgi:ADP-ribose pyrophosphatase YjhB (NUDIX family)
LRPTETAHRIDMLPNMAPACASLQRHYWMRRAVCLSMAITSTRSCLGFGSWTHTAPGPVVPRAAVSVVVRALSDTTHVAAKYVLVQRGKEPNKGMWSLPGGKIELGESTLHAAQRELWEETRLSSPLLKWHSRAFCVSDSIHRDEVLGQHAVQYHYVIAQCFCTVPFLQPLIASDDAADAKWFTLQEMQHLQKLTPGVIQVLEISENMYEKGLFCLQ